MRRREPDEPPSAPRWIVTFSDMMSLLVTFFVMLFSFSTDMELDAFPVPGLILGGRRGVLKHENRPDIVQNLPEDLIVSTDGRRGARIPHARPEQQLEADLLEMGQKLAAGFKEVDFGRTLDGLFVRFDPTTSFAPGSAEVSEILRGDLIVLAEVLQHYRHLIVVEGFTDSGFEATPAYPTPYDLSAERATAAAEVLRAHSDLPAEVIQIAGLGDTRPIDDGATASGRARNRRVEVRILALSNARAAALEAHEARDRGEGR